MFDIRAVLAALVALVISLSPLRAEEDLIGACRDAVYTEAAGPCTKVIEATRSSREDLIFAYARRAEAYTSTSYTTEYIKKSIEDLTEALRLQEDAGLYQRRAQLYAALGEFGLGDADINKGVDLTSSVDTYATRAGYFLGTGRFEKALEDYRRAMKMNPSKAEAWVWPQAMSYLGLGMSDKTITLMLESEKKMLEKRKKEGTKKTEEVFIHGTLGVAYFYKKEYDTAIGYLSKAIKDYSHPLLLVRRGQCYAAKGDYASAIADYTLVLTKNRNTGYLGSYVSALHLRADAYEKMGKEKLAMADRVSAIFYEIPYIVIPR